MLATLQSNLLTLGLGVLGGLLLTVVAMLAMRWIIVYLPADYFAKQHPHTDHWQKSHPAIRWSIFIGKNAAGAALLFVGVFMMVTPGPGVLALLFGLSLVDVPGKRALERKLIGLPRVLRRVNRWRAEANQPPLEL